MDRYLRVGWKYAPSLINVGRMLIQKKMSAPLPEMDGILRNVCRHKHWSLVDGKDAYEQIRVATEDVHKTLFNTPDGTMESLVMQQGDCNASATYQSLMNHLFSSYIGTWMDVYLDDIVIYSDTKEEHLEHVKIALGILKAEKLYLSAKKWKFFATELKLLGHTITERGIQMDLRKVD